ncbi:hypothetical protein LEP1GSC192_3191 [Leptospira sp. B5-022]|nr:hypothetical protein LEP1GSC192_3191 [Leptospira sp. B5-022]
MVGFHKVSPMLGKIPESESEEKKKDPERSPCEIYNLSRI